MTIDAEKIIVSLPVINDDDEIISFAKQMTDVSVTLLGEGADDDWKNLFYNGLVALLSAKRKGTSLILLTALYHNPEISKIFLAKIMNREVYDFWTKEIPQFMQRANASESIHSFDLKIVSLLDKQEIQDLCKR